MRPRILDFISEQVLVFVFPHPQMKGFGTRETENTNSLLSACCCYGILHSESSFLGGVFTVLFL